VVPPSEKSLVGTILDDRYEVLARIGAGGVGEVYRARMQKLDRLVAVKVLHESLVANATFVARFQREVKAMSRMYHPHCVAVIDHGLVHERPYLVLEYLAGQTVSKLLRQGPMPAERAVGVALQVLDALSYFHGQSVVHRDLKSENIMLVEAGATRDFVKVLDFGMAKLLDHEPGESQLSMRGVVVGTVSAMAPEQIQQLFPDRRIDIYATGILLYEMIVGRRPFRASDPKVLARMQLMTRPQAPRALAGETALSAELEQVILKALEKERSDRFATADEMADALRRTPEGAGAPRPSGSRAPEPPAEITMLESLLADAEPDVPAASDVQVSDASGTGLRGRPEPRWLLPVVVLLAAVTMLAWVNRSWLGRLVGVDIVESPP
jgi:eukaryotic-like serine/threonine-protein kinase